MALEPQEDILPYLDEGLLLRERRLTYRRQKALQGDI
jgi:hypothetical protein